MASILKEYQRPQSGRNTVFNSIDRYYAMVEQNKGKKSLKPTSPAIPKQNEANYTNRKHVVLDKSPSQQKDYPRHLNKGQFYVDILETTIKRTDKPKGMKHFKSQQKQDFDRRVKSQSKLSQFSYYLNSNQIKETFIHDTIQEPQTQKALMPKNTEYFESFQQPPPNKLPVKTSRMFSYGINSNQGFYLR